MTTHSMTIRDVITLIKLKGEHLASDVRVDGMPPMNFKCTFADSGVNQQELAEFEYDFSDDLIEFWRECHSAKLFVDREYGQWGLNIFEPREAVEATKAFDTERKRDVLPGDLVLGEFIGDSDLLIVRCDRIAIDFGTVLVALPLDARSDWYVATSSFKMFLIKYAQCGGEKFWITNLNSQ